MVSKDFVASWKPATINTDSNELVKLAELSENMELSWKSFTLSSLNEKTLFNVDIILNGQGDPLLQFSEKSKYYFELNNNVLHIKGKYTETTSDHKINIQFANGEIPAVLSMSGDGLWAATQGGVCV